MKKPSEAPEVGIAITLADVASMPDTIVSPNGDVYEKVAGSEARLCVSSGPAQVATSAYRKGWDAIKWN